MPNSPRVNIHASAVVIGAAAVPFGAAPDTAVILLGASGSGKSDVALRLIAMGAQLLSDDRTTLFVNDGKLFAESEPSLHGQIEMRGVGIVRLPPAGPAKVGLAVMLGSDEPIERLPERLVYQPPAPLQLLLPPPLLRLRAFEASTPSRIAAVAAALARGGFVAGIAGG